MQVLACNWPLQSPAAVGAALPRHFGRRRLCFDGISSVCSRTGTPNTSLDLEDDNVSSKPMSISRCKLDCVSDLGAVLSRSSIPFTTRRVVEVPEGNGSGVVWDGNGHIVTNYHVIANALSRNPSLGQVVARVNILTLEGVQKNFEGKLIGADRAKDLAVLKIDASGDLLRPIQVGPSSYLKVGQQCLAIGNPFGFDHTLTVGVISGLNRDIFIQTGVIIGGGIQTDAAINPGNSGGPLLDSKGNLIGINTAIFTQTGTSSGVGFAIPSSTVLKIIPQLIQFGKVVHAALNIDIAPDLIANQLNVQNGALVLQVPRNSLAAKAGMQPTTRGLAGNILLGDVIVAVDNKPVRSKVELFKLLDDYNVGDKILLKIQRGSHILELPIFLEEKS